MGKSFTLRQRLEFYPAEFLIDSTRRIRWVNLTENIAVRARPEQVLKAFDEMEQTAAR